MSSRFHKLLLACVASLFAGGFISVRAVAETPSLRICADPDNLPYSNSSLGGFDNQIAALLARDIGRKPVFVWARSRRGFLRERFNKGACDVLMGVPEGMKHVQTTVPYYRSSYVFVTRSREHLHIASFDDPVLDNKRIGLQILESDYSPPSLPLIRAGHTAQLVGYEPFGREAGSIVRAVADKKIGVAVIWGPLAGYYARKQSVPLSLAAVSPSIDRSGIPFVFNITAAVHSKDTDLAEKLNRAIREDAAKIDRILRAYNVPQLPLTKDGGA
ncbi:MAG TPA: quinoprotein dehydrogenase-associated putative ABC transporter substrate-binding protein [Edaphobacter sp.]|nr:quinoprotein dehydrogenase-associated putative ABC transporter substrate-binding protein [Edaphobacter sp.]